MINFNVLFIYYQLVINFSIKKYAILIIIAIFVATNKTKVK